MLFAFLLAFGLFLLQLLEGFRKVVDLKNVVVGGPIVELFKGVFFTSELVEPKIVCLLPTVWAVTPAAEASTHHFIRGTLHVDD